MDAPAIILFDVPMVVGRTVSIPSTWRARYALNFKGVAYETVWVEFPDIAAALSSIGATPPAGTHPNGDPHYPLPIIVDRFPRSPSGSGSGGPTVVCGSWDIVAYLDAAYPHPGLLIPEGTHALQAAYIDLFFEVVISPCMPILVPDVHARLNARSKPYYRFISQTAMDVDLEHMCPLGSTKREAAWVAIQKGFARFAALLGKEPSAFVTGPQPVFADMAIAAFLETVLLLHPETWNARIKSWHGGRWEAMRSSCAMWKDVRS